jgi:hypothetical protein
MFEPEDRTDLPYRLMSGGEWMQNEVVGRGCMDVGENTSLRHIDGWSARVMS